MGRRVVITGMGAITPIGIGVKEFWKNIQKGRTGFAPIHAFDTTDYKVKIAAEAEGFVPGTYMDEKAARRMERFCQFAVAAAKEAMEDSGICTETEDPYRIGCSIGSGIGSMQAMEREHSRLLEKGPNRVNPLFIPVMISNMAAGNVSIQFGLKGKNINVVTACASGTNSIGEAFRTIQYGDADVMLAGGTEAAVTPLGIAGFSSLTALSQKSDITKCCLPFDKRRSGFVMGEGAGVLVLEELAHAKKRKAQIYAEIVGYGCTADAYHITSPCDSGEHAARAMELALLDAGVKKGEITYINAHGTGTHHNDLFETRAIKLAFGEQAKKLRINSTKSMTDHLLGAAGAIEGIVCAKTLQEGFIHRTVGFEEAEEEMDLDYCKCSYEEEVPYALSNSLGFGGHNASLLFKRYREE